MDFIDDPEDLTPEERTAEIAAILATGYMRLRGHVPQLANDAIPAPPSTENPLDCSDDRVPLCDEGLTDGESAPVEAER
jgi:hypothetical protein